LGSPPLSPVAGNTSPTTTDSRSCTDSGLGRPRTARSTPHRPPPRPYSPSLSEMLARPPPWRSETACPATSVRSPGSSRITPVDHQTNPGNPSPSLHPHYRSFTATTRYETARPRAPHRYSAPCRFRCWEHSLRPASPTPDRHHRGDRFPRFVPMPDPSSRHLYAGHHLANKSGTRQAHPGAKFGPRFR
jgi:hypothetical protein